MKPNHETELDWQAFLYVSDEMSTEEQSRFEAQLAHDQQAREAVARAVDLQLVAKSALEKVSVQAERPVAFRTTSIAGFPDRRRGRSIAIFTGFALAACLLLAVAVQTGLFRRGNKIGNPSTETNPLDELARNWPSVFEAAMANEARDDAGVPVSAAGELSALTADSEEKPADEVPLWMKAAFDHDSNSQPQSRSEAKE